MGHQVADGMTSKPKAPTGSLLVSADEFLSSIADASSKPIIKGVAYEGSGLMIYSRQGLGKTRIAVQLAHALGTGEPWLGVLPVARTGQVVYLQLDMSPVEWGVLLGEAGEAGLDTTNLVCLPPSAPGVNVLDRPSFEPLRSEIRGRDPLALVVDAGLDAYEGAPRSEDINQTVLRVLHRLRECVPNGLLIYMLHDRKKGALTSDQRNEGDEDAFAGGGGWERFASTSLRLVRGDSPGAIKLVVRKTRFEGPGFTELPLRMCDNGFFQPVLDHKWMLAAWPDCLPVDDRTRILADGVATKAAVYADIAERTGASQETVKKQAQRHVQMHAPYAWEPLVGGGK